MIRCRRWFQYSLRSFLVVLTALAVWLGIVVNRAREQREALKAIQALQWSVAYDYHFKSAELPPQPDGSYDMDEAKVVPTWLQGIIDDDYFQNVEQVGMYVPEEQYVLEAIPYLKRFRHLKRVCIREGMSSETEARLSTALPDCQIAAIKCEPGRWVTRQIHSPSPAARP